MSPPPLKEGALTRDELLDIWRGAVDENYSAGLEEAGDGNGLEVIGQAAEQWARVSKAVDRSTQAMFILPWSGQTAEPASGERFSEVTLTFTRTKRLERPLVLAAGVIFVEEETEDYGDNGPETVRTGRRYALKTSLVFHPGDAGPYTVEAIAERPGWGYDNPLPTTLRVVTQVGADFSNNLGTVVTDAAATPASDGPYIVSRMIAENQPDMPIPDHVGQHMLFVAGSNAGKIARVSAFDRPDPVLDKGSTVFLDVLKSFSTGTFTGTFIDDEIVKFDNGADPVLGYGRVVGTRDAGGVRKMTVVMLNGVSSTRIVGLASAATMTGVTVRYQDAFVSEAPSGGVGGATWRVLAWDRDFGLTVTNDESPEGGAHAFLDELGDERDMKRVNGEGDDSYRQRVAHAPDTVAPNAIRRALNRTFSSTWEFREVGSTFLPGFFYDGNGEPPSGTPGRAVCDAYDTDVIRYTGVLTGTFDFQERAIVTDDDGNFSASGYVGRLDAGNTELLFIFDGSIKGQLFAGSTYRVRGLRSGATFLTTDGDYPDSAHDRRWRRIFDYAEFRAFFIVVLQRLGLGEFGFAWDEGAYGLEVFDGYPPDAARAYLRVQNQLNGVKAGAVGFLFEHVKTKPTVTILPP